jgi:hypothetical protein
MSTVYLVLFGVAVIITFFLLGRRSMRKPNNNNKKKIETLKNALLSFALMRLGTVDDGPSVAFNAFDGTKLPSFSGHDLLNACFSYIIDKDQFSRCKFYSIYMAQKLLAIDKYVNKNLNTDEQIQDFFGKFVQTFDSSGSKECIASE